MPKDRESFLMLRDDKPQQRRRRTREAEPLVGATLLLALLAGCSGHAAESRRVRDALARLNAPGNSETRTFAEEPDNAGMNASEPAPVSIAPDAAGRSAEEPAALDSLVAIALRDNPAIRAADESVRAALAKIPQASAPPDPELLTRTLPEPAQYADGSNYFILSVMMSLPLPEKLDRAGRVALEEAWIALHDAERMRREVAAEVRRAYSRAYILDRTIETNLANRELLRGLIDVAHAEVAAGRRSQDDILRAQVELYALDSEVIDLRRERTEATADLNRLTARPAGTDLPALINLTPRTARVDRERVLAQADRFNPVLLRLQRQIERDRHAVRAAELASWPDLKFGIEWMYQRDREAMRVLPDPQTGMIPEVDRMSERGMDMWAIVAGINLPIWRGRIEGGIAEARSRLAASQHELAAERHRVASRIATSLSAVAAKQELVALFANTIIPQARQAYEVSRAAYSGGGKGDFPAVIESWRKWLAFTVQYHRSIAELETALADLEEAAGAGVAELEAQP
ncbi:MAG: TolC family protein [Planctomycetota bacterium]|nr:MAG: TolC family protein [Planctomycetota bacterium]KAB2940747.1 MAG: TolC family protein [Phycisphaerae bacterium]MCQ3920421.1 hypothetical protein [Planctomycetota bacterium]